MSEHALTFDLTGKTALVTGGTSGIGLAIAQALLAHHANVVVGSRSQSKLDDAYETLTGQFDAAHVLVTPLDVAQPEQIDHAIEATQKQFERVDILINCAGVNKKIATREMALEDAQFIMDVNYTGAFYACQQFARVVEQQGPSDPHSGGYSIINIASVTSFLALSEVTAYAASKGAILALTRQLAVEWPRLYGIRCNAIAPGFVPADQNRKILESGDRGKRILQNTPLERFGTPEEIAPAVVYLASPAGRFLNGTCIDIDGGFMTHGVSDAMAQ